MTDKAKQPKLDKAYDLLDEAYEEEMTPEQQEQRDTDWWLGIWHWPEAKHARQLIELCMRLIEEREGSLELWPKEHLDILGIEPGDPILTDPDFKAYVQLVHEPAMDELEVMEACTMLHLKGQQLIAHHVPRLDSYAEWRAKHGTRLRPNEESPEDDDSWV
jgi:hypothetical protein